MFLTGRDALENTCNGQDPGMEARRLVLPSTEIVCMCARVCVNTHLIVVRCSVSLSPHPCQ